MGFSDILLFVVIALVVVVAIYVGQMLLRRGGYLGGCGTCAGEAHAYDTEHDFVGSGQGMPRIFSRDKWFDEIEAGKKTVDSRVGTEDRNKELVGKRVKIVAPGKKLFATVTAVRMYKTLDEYIDGETVKKIAPHLKTKADVIAALLEIKNKAGEVVYDPKRVAAKEGITAIEFKLDDAGATPPKRASKKAEH